MSQVADYLPWYCNGSVFSTLLGCNSYLPTQQDQIAIMASNFGPSADPSLVASALVSANTSLTQNDYTGNLQAAVAADNAALNPLSGVDWNQVAMIAACVIGAFVFLGGAKR